MDVGDIIWYEFEFEDGSSLRHPCIVMQYEPQDSKYGHEMYITVMTHSKSDKPPEDMYDIKVPDWVLDTFEYPLDQNDQYVKPHRINRVLWYDGVIPERFLKYKNGNKLGKLPEEFELEVLEKFIEHKDHAIKIPIHKNSQPSRNILTLKK